LAHLDWRDLNNIVDVLERFGARREGMMANALYYGDNLPVLRESIAYESIDLPRSAIQLECPSAVQAAPPRAAG
jgi:hypothetical protein